MNITYLFGAGASANAIPTIDSIKNHLEVFLDYLESYKFPQKPKGPTVISQHSRNRKNDVINSTSRLQKDIEWLISNLRYATSIDTFAKRLFIKENTNKVYGATEANISEYNKLKALMMIFFIFEHFRTSTVDKDGKIRYLSLNDIALRNIDPRYDNFFASLILKNLTELPNIKILSWNYDMQFELAFDEYTGFSDFIKNQIHLQVYPSQESDGFDLKRFGIVKLNGSLQIKSKGGIIQPLLFSDKSLTINSLIGRLINEYNILTQAKRPYPYLFFSWENRDVNLKIKNIACEIIKNTEILVVIGYSFPYFNRVWDRDIFGIVKALEKVYFQAPSDDLDNYLTRFKTINRHVLRHENISDLKQFFIPPELS